MTDIGIWKLNAVPFQTNLVVRGWNVTWSFIGENAPIKKNQVIKSGRDVPLYLLSVIYTSHHDSETPWIFVIILIKLTYCNHPARYEDILKRHSCSTLQLKVYWNKAPQWIGPSLGNLMIEKGKLQTSHATQKGNLSLRRKCHILMTTYRSPFRKNCISGLALFS